VLRVNLSGVPVVGQQYNKNDRNDAEAICEAMSRPTMRFVQVKDVEQQDIQAVHRIREELMSQRASGSLLAIVSISVRPRPNGCIFR
jgi:hypothetical protein